MAVTALGESRNDESPAFDTAFIRSELQGFMDSITPTPSLSPHCFILRNVNIRLRALQSDDVLVEEAVGADERTLIQHCKIPISVDAAPIGTPRMDFFCPSTKRTHYVYKTGRPSPTYPDMSPFHVLLFGVKQFSQATLYSVI